jgi:protein TonB
MRPTIPQLDFEALRVMMIMPKWAPGVQDGKQVAVWYKLPVKFTLSD